AGVREGAGHARIGPSRVRGGLPREPGGGAAAAPAARTGRADRMVAGHLRSELVGAAPVRPPEPCAQRPGPEARGRAGRDPLRDRVGLGGGGLALRAGAAALFALLLLLPFEPRTPVLAVGGAGL